MRTDAWKLSAYYVSVQVGANILNIMILHQDFTEIHTMYHL